MKSTTSQKTTQVVRVESARRDLAWAANPHTLLCLPFGDRAAALEVYAALQNWLRLGSEPRRVTDETLLECPWLRGRSVEHVRKGLEILVAQGLIARESRGSRREVAVLPRLKGRRDEPVKPRAAAPIPKPKARPVKVECPELNPWFKARMAKAFPELAK